MPQPQTNKVLLGIAPAAKLQCGICGMRESLPSLCHEAIQERSALALACPWMCRRSFVKFCRKQGIKEAHSGPLVKDWLLKQTGKPKVNKNSTVKFDELLSKLEAVAATPEEVVKILKA